MRATLPPEGRRALRRLHDQRRPQSHLSTAVWSPLPGVMPVRRSSDPEPADDACGTTPRTGGAVPVPDVLPDGHDFQGLLLLGLLHPVRLVITVVAGGTAASAGLADQPGRNVPPPTRRTTIHCNVQHRNLVEQPGERPLSTIGSVNGLCQAKAALRMKPPPCLLRSHAPTTKQVVRAAFPSTA